MYGSLDSAPAPDPAASTPASTAIAKTGTILKEKIPAAPDTDTSTRQTIAKMCEYIAAGVSDPVCQWWAAQARERWKPPGADASQLCWGVWWLVKHAIKFAKDEPRLFQIGEPEALDLLIAPAVLVRDPAPKEDCDGFTMLVCCLLKILGIPSVIVTVAADPSDSERWSHVFPMAQLGGANLPMDCSHGKFPGWMVPREHITRWQAWDLNGNPVQAFPAQSTNTLHGYLPRGSSMRRTHRRRRGVGQVDTSGIDLSGSGYDPSSFSTDTFDISSSPFVGPINNPSFSPPALPTTSGVPFGTCVGPGCGSQTGTLTSAADSSSFASVLNSLVSGGLKAAQLATLPPGYVLGANGQPIYTGQSAANAQLTSSFAGILPWLAIGVVAVLIFGEIGKK